MKKKLNKWATREMQLANNEKYQCPVTFGHDCNVIVRKYVREVIRRCESNDIRHALVIHNVCATLTSRVRAVHRKRTILFSEES